MTDRQVALLAAVIMFHSGQIHIADIEKNADTLFDWFNESGKRQTEKENEEYREHRS